LCRSFNSFGVLVLQPTLILIPMLGKHGLACVPSLGQLLAIFITFILFLKLSKSKTVLHASVTEHAEKLLEKLKLKKFQHLMKMLRKQILLKKQINVRMIEVSVQTILIRMKRLLLMLLKKQVIRI
jgi:hypothetical protein